MKKIIILVAVSLFIGINAKAQKKSKSSNAIKEVHGTELKIKKQNRVADFTSAFKIDNEYYAIGRQARIEVSSYILLYLGKSYYSDFIIYKLDSKMNHKETTIIPAEYFGKDVQSLTIKKLGNKLCAFFYFNNKKQMKQYLFAQLLDLGTLGEDGEPYKIAETPILKKEKNIECLFEVDVTDDNSKMFITTDRSKVETSKSKRKAAAAQKSHTFSYWLISSKMELISSGKNVKMGKGNITIVAHTTDNAGNMCILGYEETINKTKGKKKSDEEGSEYAQSRLVMKIIKKNGDQSDLEFAKGEQFYNADLKLNPNTGNVAVVGLLSSGKRGAKGIFTQQVNLSTGETGDETLQLFGSALIKEINSLKPPAKFKSNGSKEKIVKRKKNTKDFVKLKEADDYIKDLVRVGSIHYTDSNEIIVVTQKYYSYQVTYTSTDSKGHTTSHTVTYYVYSDIIPFKLNAYGEIESYGFVFYNNVKTTGYRATDFNSLYVKDKLYVMSSSQGGQIDLNNKATTLHDFKENESYKSKRRLAEFVNVSPSENVTYNGQQK